MLPGKSFLHLAIIGAGTHTLSMGGRQSSRTHFHDAMSEYVRQNVVTIPPINRPDIWNLTRGRWQVNNSRRGHMSISRLRKAGRNISHRSKVVAAMIRLKSAGSCFYPLNRNRADDELLVHRDIIMQSRPLSKKVNAAAEYYIQQRSILDRILQC